MESPTVTFPASFEAGLGMSQLMSKDGLWQEYLLGLSRFISQEQFRPWARSTQHQQCFSTLRNPSEGETLLREEPLTTCHEEGHVEENPWLPASGALVRPWRQELWCEWRRS